jgi:hypothetical protein
MKKLADIIPFPKSQKASKPKSRLKLTDVLVDRLADTDRHLKYGQVNFTCPDCKHTSSFDFNQLIFKAVSFFCGGCGHGYTITNPIFENTDQKNNKNNLRPPM